MSDSEHILDELRRIIGDAQCAGPASQGDIDATETALGATLPPSFRTFLLHFGAGALPAPFTLVGLPPTRKSATKGNSKASKSQTPIVQTATDISQNLAQQLKELRLPSFREHYQDVAQLAAAESFSYE